MHAYRDRTPYKMKLIIAIAVAVTVPCLVTGGSSPEDASSKLRFSDIITYIQDRRLELSRHPFFKMLGDESIPAAKRMSFTPYWAFFAFSFADVLGTWIYNPNPQSDLEQRINIFVSEDDYHYNFFLHDMETLGYTIDRFGSAEAVLRHMWSDESRAIRDLIYTWVLGAKMYNDPIVTLATFEGIEAGLKDLFEVAYGKVFLPEGGLKDLEYFGGKHVELEQNHTQTGWFKDIYSPLAQLEITEQQKANALTAIDAMFEK